MTSRVLLAAGWLACMLCGCGDDASVIQDRSGSGVVDVWDPPAAGGVAGRDAAPPKERAMPANWSLITAPDRVDMVHDARRNLLYVSTKRGEVQRWNLETRLLVGTWNLGGSLGGMDLSPDADTLIVADQSRQADGVPKIHRIDLVSEAVRAIDVPDAGENAGTFSVVCIDDARVLVSSASQGVSNLQVVTLDDELSGIVHQVGNQTLLVSDPSRSFIAYASLGDWLGTFGTYSIADGTFRETKANAQVFEIAVSRGAQRFALATRDELRLLDSNFEQRGSISAAGHGPIGVAFGLPSGSVSVAWLERSPPKFHPAIESYDAETSLLIARLYGARGILLRGPTIFVSGHMKASSDGRRLFVSVDEGVLVLALAP
jgi:hypothetical protein